MLDRSGSLPMRGQPKLQPRAQDIDNAPVAISISWRVIGLAELLAIEALIFYATVIYEITPFYPQWYDQAKYLSYSYWLAEQTHRDGWSAIISEYLNPTHGPG